MQFKEYNSYSVLVHLLRSKETVAIEKLTEYRRSDTVFNLGTEIILKASTMLMKKILKEILRTFGIEIRRYSPDRSDDARLARILLYQKIDLVLDIGANVGQYARSLRTIGYQGKIVSFEPLAQAHSELLRSSSNDDLWTIAPRTAVGDSDGAIPINIAGNSVSSSVLPMLDSHKNAAPESAYTNAEMVPIAKVDTIAPQYVNQARSIYMKIDVQGFEKNVLDGAKQILPRVKMLQLELSLVPLYEGELLFREMLERLDALGFELYALIPGFSDNATGRLLQCDGIFIRK